MPFLFAQRLGIFQELLDFEFLAPSETTNPTLVRYQTRIVRFIKSGGLLASNHAILFPIRVKNPLSGEGEMIQ